MTFEQAARVWHTHRLAALDKGHAERLMARLERDAFPALGRIDLKAVTAADMLAMVRSVEARGALNVRARALGARTSQASTKPARFTAGLHVLGEQERAAGIGGGDNDQRFPELKRVIDDEVGGG